ncbi:hypothetical protein E2C01_046357 [Portunus trituberculatus]|uniref:Uncharacterized protein n=1 Tax=Portunus trituberculatus TaxID=210409 RepID=A0A5B7G4N4_PORTR|nr:hypothetical protein [Portunus trituberculatus]
MPLAFPPSAEVVLSPSPPTGQENQYTNLKSFLPPHTASGREEEEAGEVRREAASTP